MTLIHRHLGRCDYADTLARMQAFTDTRDETTTDEVWTLEHPPIYTRGMRDRTATPTSGSIPVLDIDRGGLITYHGPGQLVVYTLIDLKRARFGVRCLVDLLEDATIGFCADHGVTAARRDGAPGVYVNGEKLASLGLRVRRGASYHGIAVNVDMDLEPFSWIEPCGLEGITMTQLAALGIQTSIEALGLDFARRIGRGLGRSVTS